MSNSTDLVLPLSALRRGDVARVGGKNSSLGEMISTLKSAGISVPGGFATTATPIGASSKRTTYSIASHRPSARLRRT